MRGHDLFRYAVVVAAVLCYLTILIGGTVMARDDGLACPHWPTCYANPNLFPSLASGASVEWAHRVSAFALSLGVLAVALLALVFERARPVLLRLSLVALGLVVVEALLGGAVVQHDLALVLVLVHLALATALFGLLLVLTLLANLREIPQRWVAWALRATERAVVETPSSSAPEPSPTSLPTSGPG